MRSISSSTCSVTSWTISSVISCRSCEVSDSTCSACLRIRSALVFAIARSMMPRATRQSVVRIISTFFHPVGMPEKMVIRFTTAITISAVPYFIGPKYSKFTEPMEGRLDMQQSYTYSKGPTSSMSQVRHHRSPSFEL